MGDPYKGFAVGDIVTVINYDGKKSKPVEIGRLYGDGCAVLLDQVHGTRYWNVETFSR